MSWKGGNQWGGAAQSWGNQGASASSWGNQGQVEGTKGGMAQRAAAALAPMARASTTQGWGLNSAPKTSARPAPPGPSLVQVDATLSKLTRDFATQETVVKSALENATKKLEDANALAASLKGTMDVLEKHQTKLNELKTTIIKECAEARKGGIAVATPAQQMSTLLVKCNQLCQQVLATLNKLKPKHIKAQNEAEAKKKEVADAAAFKAVLTQATGAINAAANAVNAVGKQVDALVLKPPEGEALDTKITSVEKAAEEAAKKCETARTELNEKIKGVQAYAAETKKKAHADLMELQKKLSENVKKNHVYKAFKKEFPKLLANQKAIVEVTEKLAGHEAAITKASKVAEKKDISKDQVQSIDEALDPVRKALTSANAIISAKIRVADAPTLEKFTKLKTRSEELKKKVDAVIEKIKARRDIISSDEGIETAKEKLEKVQEAFTACQEAEMPFLTGLEVLPGDVNESALKECTETLKAVTEASSAARTWVNEHLRRCRTFEKDLAKTTSDALNAMSTQLRELETKVANFRKELQERTVTSAVSEILSAFESSVKSAAAVGERLALSSLDDKPTDGISKAIEEVKAAIAEANSQAQEARKSLETKKKEGKVPGAALGQITTGLSAGQNKVQHLRSIIVSAEKLVKAKGAILSGEEAVKEAEASAQKAKALSPKEGKSLTMEKVTLLDQALSAATKTIAAAGNAVQPHLLSAPPKTKAELQTLLDRKKAASDAVNQIKADTKERREETLSTHYLEDAEAKAKAAEECAAKLDQAEGPFLTGASHDLKKTQETLAKCEEAASEVQAAITASRQQSTQKTQESKTFGEASSKKVKEGLAAMSDRLKKVSTRLETFRKETRERTKESKVVEAGEKVDALEASLKQTLAAAAPFEKEGAESLSEADAAAPLATYMDLDKETRKQISTTRNFVGECEREQKGNASQVEGLKKLQERITNASKELSEKKKVTAVHEQRALGTRLLAESKEQLVGLDAAVKKATEACAALLEKGGEDFLAGACVKVLVKALKAHMEEKELTEQALFKEAGKGKKMKETDFIKYLTVLPEAIGHDELSAFTEARMAVMFKNISADGKSITQEDFKAMFAQKHNCIRAVAVTNQYDVEGSETICKLEPKGSEVVSVFGPIKEDGSGMVRSECTVDGKKGWITMQQKNGSRFLALLSPFSQFCSEAEKAISASEAAVREASTALTARIQKIGKPEDGSRLKEAKDEMLKLGEPAATARKEMQQLSNKFRQAKNEYSTKERVELNAHITARNLKEATPFIEGPKAKLEALEASAKAAEEAAAPMISLSGGELESFATPASVLEAVKKFAAEVTEKASEVREAVKEQQKAASEVAPQTGGTAEAKKQLGAISATLQTLVNQTTKFTPVLTGKCSSLVKAKLDPASEGIRVHAQAKKLSPQELFDKLKVGDKIPEKAFCKLLQSLDGLSINAEHAKLICRKLEADGISKDTFINYVVIYYKIKKTIAFTDGIDIGKCKTLRKGNDNEIIEVLEGPVTVTHEASTMTRIRGKATAKDGTVTEGWLTVSGSKGTPFLEKFKPVAAAAAKK